MTMNCNSVRDRLSAFMDGELASDSAAQVQQHLAGCETCSHELAQFEQLGTLVRANVEPSIAPPAWNAIAVRLGNSVSGTSQAASVTSTSHRNRELAPGRSQLWTKIGGALVALAATVLLVANLVTNKHDLPHSMNQTSIAAINLQPVLELFQRDSDAAIDVLKSQFKLKDIDLADADIEFGRPTYVSTASKDHVLPGNATVASTKMFSFPSCQCPEGQCTCGPGGCNCIACVCQRPDGSMYLVIEQCKSQTVGFGDLPVQLVMREGREMQQVTVNGTRAISFNRASGKVTVLGLRSDAEIDSLFASL